MSDGDFETEEDELETKELSVSNMSPAVIQAVYKELIDSTESLAKTFQPGRIVTREDVKSFCQRFQQTCEQYDIKGAKTEFTIRRENDHTEKFTRLDRFLAADSGGSRLTSALTVEFKFLIKPPQREKYQEYKASLHIDSTDFTQKTDTEAFLVNMIGMPAFWFNVEYVDYSVARSLVAMTEEWYKSLGTVKTSPVLDWIKRRFNVFTDQALYTNTSVAIITFISILSCYNLLKVWNIGETNHDLLIFMGVSLALIYTSRSIAILLSGYAVRVIGRYRVPNFVIINKADDKNLNEFSTHNQGILKSGLIAIFGAAFTILINVIAAWIFKYFFQ